MPTQDQLLAALATVTDANTGKDFVSSKSIKNLQITGEDVAFDVEPIQIRPAARRDVGHKLLRRDAGFLGGNHDGRAMCVVGTDKVDRVALHALKPHPDVGLDVFHDVADMKVAVGVGQGGGDEELA